MKAQDVLLEVSKTRRIRLVFTNFNDRTQDTVYRLTLLKLDKLIDVHSLLSFVAKRHSNMQIREALEAVSDAIKSGQPMQNEEFFGMHFAIDVIFGDSARGISFYVGEDGAVTFKIRVDEVDQPGIINFDANFTEFKAFIKQSLE